MLTHLSLALNSSVFTGDPVGPDKQTSIFEYQQHVSMSERVLKCERVGTAGEFNGAWQFRQKDLNNFNILYKHQLTDTTCMVPRMDFGHMQHYWYLAGRRCCYRGDRVTNPSYFQSLLKSCSLTVITTLLR